MSTLEESINTTLEDLHRKDLARSLLETVPHAESPGNMTCNQQSLLSFSSNDYLGLSQHPRIMDAAKEAINHYGIGAGASRYITGNYPLYPQLEQQISALKQTDGCLVFGSGYLTHIGIIPVLVGRSDLILADKLVHASIIDAIKLSGATCMRFRHNDAEHCDELLTAQRSSYKHCLIITEHVFSMDGDIAPTHILFDLASQHDALLLTDDAHGFGVLPDWSKHPAHIYMGTLSKAIGAYGGYVCASQSLIEFFTQKARSLIYTTALPANVIASAIAALTFLQESPERMTKPLAHARYFTKLLDLPPAVSAIVPYVIGSSDKTLEASQQLADNGFFVSAIRPPTVPKDTARLRFTFSADHTEADIETLVGVITRFRI